ncbi:MAG: ATP synthase F1 subunit gamma [Armatimonadota bacterium]
MPENLRVLRRKREIVGEIRQITRAMKLVSAAKLKRSMDWRTSAQDYFTEYEAALALVAACASDVSHRYLIERPVERVGLLLVAGDKGLCGAFNSQIISRAREFVRSSEPRAMTVTVGSRTAEMARRARLNVVREFPAINERERGADVRQIARHMMRLYDRGEVDRVVCCYSRFLSRISNEPDIQQVIPVPLPEPPEEETAPIFEPPAVDLVRSMVPQYVVARIFQLLLSSAVSEHSARLMAMTAATDNAEEMIDDLTRLINRARQAAITEELLDIAAGADALGQNV